MPKIFDPYFSTKAKGRGLGLATCRSIVEEHRGHIEATSTPGAGTVFAIYLPVSGSEEIPSEVVASSLRKGTGRVLVMDDDANVCSFLMRLLPRLGYDSEFVPDGTAALDAYKKARAAGKPFDLVVMDLTIPGGMGGKEAIGKLKQIDAEVRVIVSSGYSEDPVIAEYASHGFVGTLPKPYTAEEISAILSTFIGEGVHRNSTMSRHQPVCHAR